MARDPDLDASLASVTKIMRRGLSIAVAGIVALELAYVLRANLPDLGPGPGCYPGSVDVCESRPFAWLWIGFAMLLFLTAMALLFRSRFSLTLGFLTQAALLLGLAHNLSLAVGWSLSQGSIWSGIASWYPDLLFSTLALCVSVGPALTLLAIMIATPAEPNRRMARVGALLLATQLVCLAARR